MTPPAKNENSVRLWGGRFTGEMDPLMDQYNESLSFDRVFYAQDIKGSIAYARANLKAGILTQEEFEMLEEGLKKVLREWDEGKFQPAPGDEGEVIGTKVAGKLHTGRSRNDQIATDMRMWLRDELNLIEELLIDLLKVVAQRAKQDIDYIMPSYTHLQRAQPIRWSHWLLSYATAFQSDLERLRFTKRNINKLPLGSGAVAGNAFGIDRMQMAKELGFEGLIMNSMSAVGDRDFVVEVLQCASTIGSHLSRWSEDLIIYSSSEFGYIKLADAYTTGSSLMPQKKNSDSLELLRGKSGRIFGAMAGLMMSIKGIPSTYNKDLQESLQPMLDTVKTLKDGLQIAARSLATATVYPDKMRAALSPDMLATDLAEYLVRKGVPFRETHHLAGKMVALAEDENKGMNELSIEQFQGIDKRFGNDVLSVFDYERSVELKDAIGGTSRRAVLEQLEALKKTLGV
ncbi:argininosuccinate lyase [Endocarpon pusillum Z07020]|uniref:Arginosuccinase n=1 Tax=Endocarpon pusillum (strain Z07020 / HMAS-L-300199) TaxID=1263415 RepID=U1G9S3_ENDPU|nr:argininosuccinate lyase [Endocarpon pusillum Z07020]ERF68441.1 argininosuccinate lyase [Endocarpon pusillum Z07020]